MDTEAMFNELGVGAVTGVELLDWLNLNTFDVQDPQRFSRLKVVIDFLKKFPQDTQRFLIAKATGSKNVDKLNHMFEYINLLEKKEVEEAKIKNIESERSAVELSNVPELQKDIAIRSVMVQETLGRLKEEIAIYEK